MSLHPLHRCIVALAGFAGMVLLASEAAAQSTPEATFETAKSAAKNGDWRGYYDCLTPESLNIMAAAAVISGSVTKVTSVSSAPDGAGEASDVASRIDAVFAKHGVSADAFKVDRANPLKPPAADDLRELASGIKEKSQFISDMRSAMRVNASKKKGFEEEIAESRLEDVLVRGDTASATVVNGDKRHSIKFKLIAGAWKIDFSFILASPGGAPK
jgi:hypothetical protein